MKRAELLNHLRAAWLWRMHETTIKLVQAICYFLPKGSYYIAITEGVISTESDHGLLPHDVLSEEIIKYSACGELFLMGDFNATGPTRGSIIFEFSLTVELICIHPEQAGAVCTSEDIGTDAIGFGHQAINDCMKHWPDLGGLTCLSGISGSRTLNCLISQSEVACIIATFSIALCFIRVDHNYLHFELSSMPRALHHTA
ncbi:hypothetical protein KP509_38G022400 [Ceratopteris richardii]|uniref:Endonuclease/exonuclease/phosphatase domain-containing protein n=1 Tax=Ceratopteris richardii TaxID=49495 RepID=A0A8T2Q318_CERRI|nr:hypothetical protein KP509_38G022400 [Ceratopteris richardii]